MRHLLNRAEEFASHLVAHVRAHIHLHDCTPPGLQWLCAEGTLTRAGASGEVHQLRFPKRFPGATLEMRSDKELNLVGSHHQFAARLTGEPSCDAYPVLAQRLQLPGVVWWRQAGADWCLVWKGHRCCDETGEIVRKASFCPAFFEALSKVLAEEAGAQPGGTRDGADAFWLLRCLGMKLGSEAFESGYEPAIEACDEPDEFVRRAFATQPAASWEEEQALRAAEGEGEDEEVLRLNGRLEKRYLVIREKPWMPVQDAEFGVLNESRLNDLAGAEELVVDEHLAELLACGVELIREEPLQGNRDDYEQYYYEQSSSGVRALTIHVEAQLRSARSRLFAAPIRKQISAVHHEVPQLQMRMQHLSSRLTLLEASGELPPRGEESVTGVTVSVRHAEGTAVFWLDVDYDDSYDQDGVLRPRLVTTLSVNLDDANEWNGHQLYRQHAYREQAGGKLQTKLVPTPVPGSTRRRAREALGFPAEEMSPEVLLDACRGTMMLPFVTRLPHRVKAGDPLEWWAWVR